MSTSAPIGDSSTDPRTLSGLLPVLCVLAFVDIAEWVFFAWHRHAAPLPAICGGAALLVAAVQFFIAVAWLMRGAAALSWRQKMLLTLLASNGCLIVLML